MTCWDLPVTVSVVVGPAVGSVMTGSVVIGVLVMIGTDTVGAVVSVDSVGSGSDTVGTDTVGAVVSGIDTVTSGSDTVVSGSDTVEVRLVGIVGSSVVGIVGTAVVVTPGVVVAEVVGGIVGTTVGAAVVVDGWPGVMVLTKQRQRPKATRLWMQTAGASVHGGGS